MDISNPKFFLLIKEMVWYATGKRETWFWAGYECHGTLIPDMEDDQNCYARCKSGKIKTLAKIGRFLTFFHSFIKIVLQYL